MIAEHNDTKTEFEFHELNESAKKRAVQKHAESLWVDWHSLVTEDWASKLEKEGFLEARLTFSGFACQGDGASFSAYFAFTGEKAESYLSESELAALRVFQVQIKMDTGEVPPLKLRGRIDRSGSYYHSHSMQVSGDFEIGGWAYQYLYCYTDVELELGDRAFEKILEHARSLANEIYSDLEKEYDYQTSESGVAELSQANDWRYDKEGNLL